MLRIRELRQNNNMTMKALGSALSIAESTVSAYENGKREPDIDTLLRIADYFGVTLDYLTGRADGDKRLIIQHVALDETLRSDVLQLAVECNRHLNRLGVAAVYGYMSCLKDMTEYCRTKDPD